jgi:hypothetical protein
MPQALKFLTRQLIRGISFQHEFQAASLRELALHFHLQLHPASNWTLCGFGRCGAEETSSASKLQPIGRKTWQSSESVSDATLKSVDIQGERLYTIFKSRPFFS